MGNIFQSTLITVGPIDLERYMGMWYEIARIPMPYESTDINVTATYTMEGDHVRILNESYRDGKYMSITGTAVPVDIYNSKLKVKFDIPYLPIGDYWIIRCAANYSYAVVSSPDRNTLWILNREKTMDIELYNSIIASLTDFDTSRIIKTIQE
jgi:apolipoprotein D and lipocalin family protein